MNQVKGTTVQYCPNWLVVTVDAVQEKKLSLLTTLQWIIHQCEGLVHVTPDSMDKLVWSKIVGASSGCGHGT